MIFHSIKTFNQLPCIRVSCRHIGTDVSLRRSYLYVPASSDRMLEKSLSSTSDVIIYDLEDSVAPSQQDKTKARNRLTEFLRQGNLPDPQRIAVRVNGINTPFFDEDIVQIVASSAVESLVLPKIHSGRDLHFASRAIFLSSRSVHRSLPLNIIPSIESARGMWNVGRIAAWKSEYDILGGRLSALLFAAEDYCADTSVIRSPSRRELLYPRSQIVIAAKAFKLDAIDMVRMTILSFNSRT